MTRTCHRTLTRRGVVWLGQTCNLRCRFCYFIGRIEDAAHPEHAFMPLEKARGICSTLRDFFGNEAVDLQGGEPTLWEPLPELVRHCSAIGLHPSVITNGLALAEGPLLGELRAAGLRDLLVSVHALDGAFDRLVGKPGASRVQDRALERLRADGVPFRLNCVLTRDSAPQLPEIARRAARLGARVVNFIAYNPVADQSPAGRFAAELIPDPAALGRMLAEGLDVLLEAGIEANVRYVPFCLLEERHRPCAYHFQQLPFDHHEWDFASWDWTDRPEQRTPGPESTRPRRLQDKPVVGLPGPLDRLSRAFPAARAAAERALPAALRLGSGAGDAASLYARRGRTIARGLGFRQLPACGACSARAICDGPHAASAREGELRPIGGPRPIADPLHYIRSQEKLVEEEERPWALPS